MKTFDERLEEILLELYLADQGSVSEAKQAILDLVREMTPRSYDIPSEFNAGWNACRTELLNRLEIEK